MYIENCQILKNEKIAKDIHKMTIKTINIAKVSKPGQFINFNISDNVHLLKRPLSIYNIDNDILEVVFQTIGEGTKILAKKQGTIEITGPLGNGYNIERRGKKNLLVGGGIGIFPLHELAKQIENPVIVLGFRCKENIVLLDEYTALGEVYVATDDGSFGFSGNVIQLIEKENFDFDTIYCCGPKGMLRLIDEKYKDTKKGFISFEERMACGLGFCYGCIVKLLDKSTKRVCKDGPVFELGVIDYES